MGLIGDFGNGGGGRRLRLIDFHRINSFCLEQRQSAHPSMRPKLTACMAPAFCSRLSPSPLSLHPTSTLVRSIPYLSLRSMQG
jgi:hypothetical protein